MIIFVSTLAFSQTWKPHIPTIYEPANGSVVEYTGSTTNNVQIVFDDYGNGGAPMKHYYFNVYVDGNYVSQVTHSLFYLSLNPGIHTVIVVLYHRQNPSEPFVYFDDDSKTFTVLKVPTISISANATSPVPIGQNVFFTANYTDLDYNKGYKEIEWQAYNPLSGTWTESYEVGPYSFFHVSNSCPQFKVRARYYFNGATPRYIYSNEIFINM
jgi:hypothetical protein